MGDGRLRFFDDRRLKCASGCRVSVMGLWARQAPTAGVSARDSAAPLAEPGSSMLPAARW